MTLKLTILKDYVLSNTCKNEEIVGLVALRFRRQNLFRVLWLEVSGNGYIFADSYLNF